MTLLSDIINGIDAMPIAALLRKAKVLASRLDQPDLTVWASNELDGYPDPKNLPSYRGPHHADVIGQYRLPYTNGLADLAIPTLAFPADQRDSVVFKLVFSQPIAELEELAKKTDGLLRVEWPADLIAYVNHLIRERTPGLPVDALLVTAYRSTSPQQVKGIVDAVRSRLLDLALGLEKLGPNTGEQGAQQPPAAAVLPIVNHITAQNVNMAQNSANFNQTTNITNAPHDEAALFEALQGVGLSAQDIHDLQLALLEDRDDDGTDPEQPGPHVQGWLGRFTYKAAALGGTVGMSAAGGVVAGLVKQYFRIP